VLEICDVGIHGDTTLGSQASGLEYANRAQVDGGHLVAKFSEKHAVTSLTITDAQCATNWQLIGNFTQEVVRFGTEGKAIFCIPFVPALAT
jgi:hypothetical protein